MENKQNTMEERNKRFEEKFGGYFRKMQDEMGWHFLQDFLQSEIDLAVAEKEKEVLNNMMVILSKLQQTNSQGLSSAISEYISNITRRISKI